MSPNLKPGYYLQMATSEWEELMLNWSKYFQSYFLITSSHSYGIPLL